MNERDQLLSAVQSGMSNILNWPDDVGYKLLGVNMSEPQNAVVDAVLAAGYRKPRTITTAEELDALPHGAVVRDANGRLWEWEHIGYGGVEKALSAMGISSMLALSSFRHYPATVLHEGTQP